MKEVLGSELQTQLAIDKAMLAADNRTSCKGIRDRVGLEAAPRSRVLSY